MGKRWIWWLAAAVVLLVSILWLATTIAQLYQSLAVLSPLLAQLVVWGLGILLAAAAIALGYYGWLFLRPRRPRPQAPRSKPLAAAATLDALGQQIEQIQDDVARRALEMRSQQLRASLDRQALHITLFGVGSAGKTSLINAMAGRLAGATAAAMGTTTAPERHRLRLVGIDRELLLTDTPGIAEAGVAGSERETTARQLAAEADLLLFVVDNDLRQSEYAVLRSLMEAGKRLLLVFNKADRYPAAEQGAILEKLRSHLPQLDPADVVAVAAAPQPVATLDGGWLHPAADIDALLERLATVLRQEGATLIADSLLLQSQRLGEEARQLVDRQRQHRAEAIVERYQWVGAGIIALTPPGIDLLAAAAVNAQMVVELGRVYDCRVSIEEGKQLALSLAKTLGALGIVRGTVELLAWGLQTNLATVLAGRALQGVSAAYLTRIAGKSFIEYFRHSQTWGDGGMAAVVQEQYRLNQRQEFLQDFLRDAVSRGFSRPEVESEAP